MGDKREGVRHEKLEIPSAAAFERRFLIDSSRQKNKPNISAPPPPSDLLSRLQHFLPAMQSANAALQQQKDVLIDNVSEEVEEGGAPYVELDLACGLFDLQDDAAVAAAERSLTHQRVVVERFDGGSGSSSDSSDSSEDEDGSLSDGEGAGASRHAPREEQEQRQPPDAASPMDAEGGGAMGSADAGGDHHANAEVPGRPSHRRRRVRAKHKKRRAGIQVIG